MGKGNDHDHDHHHHGHDHDHHGDDHGHDHGEVVVEFSAKRPAKLKTLDADALILVDGVDDGSFAVASSKKELKQLMTFDADVVYDEKKGKLYLNANGEEKGWGKKKVGGLIARFKGKPELSADHFEGLESFTSYTHDHDLGNDDETPMKTMFKSKRAAKKAANAFGCKGAHKMGDFWMVCNDHADMVMPAEDYSEHDHSEHDHSGHEHASYRIV